MRAIDADAMIDRLKEWDTKDKTDKALYNFTLNRINEQPTIQPEIVRCKDCKHHWIHKCMDSMPIEGCDLEQTFYDAEIDFCSLAERRKDG